MAETQGVPPYVIFHDASLSEMARLRPASLTELALVNGVGESKLSRYGETFLRCIQAHPLPDLLDNRLSDTVNETLWLYQAGLDAEAIAGRRELKPSTIYGHFAEAIEAGLLAPLEILPMDETEYEEILSLMEQLQVCEEGRLKPLFEALDEVWDYGVLKCIMAAACA
jgi:ATP-dependent DNA helicase RecQ